MNRKLKNLILIILMIASVASTYFTITNVKSNSSNDNKMSAGGLNSNKGTPPDMNNNDSNMGTPPEKPDGKQNNQNDNSSENNSSSEENNSSENSDNNQRGPGGNMGTPPDMNNNDNSNNNNNKIPNMMENKGSMNSIDLKYYILFAIEGLVFSISLIYFLMINLSKNMVFDSNKILIFVLLIIISTISIIFIDSLITKKYFLSNNIIQTQNNASSTSATGAKEVTSVETLNNEKYSSKKNDENAILVKNKGNASIENTTIEKSGDSSNTESSDFSGVNSGVLVQENSTTTIKNTTINTNSKGANAVFSTGENSKITITNSTITTRGSASSRGLDATYGGTIIGSKLKITTNGQSSATLATDRGEGVVTVDNSTLETNGQGSPIIYSTGKITIDKVKGTANSSQMVVVEGKNSATVKDSSLIASAKGNRNDVDNSGIMIYQSMSGDAGEGTGTFTSKNSKLMINENSDVYKTAPMFFVTNTTAKINLEDTKLSYGSNILLSIKATSEWGNSGSNGGDVTLNAINQILKGDIEVDKLSTLVLNLKSSSTYEGTINSSKTAKKITLKLSKNSKIKLTGDSYIDSLENEDTTNSNIDFNGYKLYVNNKSIN